MKALRWIYTNLQTLLLAFLLAVVVWFSATTESDPNRERIFRAVPIKILGKEADLLFVGEVPSMVNVSLYAPSSRLSLVEQQPNLIQASIDLTGISSGSYKIPVNVVYRVDPARLVRIEPSEVTITLDKIVSRNFPIQVQVIGKPSTGYELQKPKTDVSEVTLKGPQEIMDRVASVRATINASGQNETMENDIALTVYDETGTTLTGLEMTPKMVHYQLPLRLLSGYAAKVVRVVTTGEVAENYRLDNILVFPLRVLLFSSDPAALEKLPGYIETEALDLSLAKENFESRLALQLPQGISVVGDQTVRVRVSIAAIESSQARKLALETIGLDPQLSAKLTVESVDVLLAGPLPVLSGLQAKDVRAVLDLTDLPIGTHQVTPQVEIIPEGVRLLSVSPQSIEVNISVLLTLEGPAASPGTGEPAREDGGNLTASPALEPTHTSTPQPTLTALPSSPPPGENVTPQP